MISEVALSKITARVMAMIIRAEIQIGGEWVRIKTPIQKDMAAGSISVIVTIGEEQAAGSTVTAIRLLDVNGDVFSQRSTLIERTQSGSGYAYQYSLQVLASEEEVTA